MARTKKKRDIEPGHQGQAERGDRGSQNQSGDSPDFVKLTDISDIVSKYAVVDKLFTDEEQNDDNAAANADSEDAVEVEAEAEDVVEAEAEDPAEVELEAKVELDDEVELDDDVDLEDEAEIEAEAEDDIEADLEAAVEIEAAEDSRDEHDTSDQKADAPSSAGEAEEEDEHLVEFEDEEDDNDLLESAEDDDVYLAELDDEADEDEVLESAAEEDTADEPSDALDPDADTLKYSRLATRPDDSVSRARAHVALLREAREAKADARHGGHEDDDSQADPLDDDNGQSRPSIVFRRPRIKDELNSDWSDNAHRAFDDIRGELRDARAQPQPYSLRAASARLPEDDGLGHVDDIDDMDDMGAVNAPGPIIARHRSNLSRSIAISIGLPIATGALFAMLLYYQKDLKPSDVWNWVATKVDSQSDQTAPPAAPATAKAQPETAPQEPDAPEAAKVAEAPAPAPASPEAGLSVTPPKLPAGTDAAAPVTAPAKLPPKKQVYMARLTVTDSQGTSLDPIPLSLSVAPAAPEQRLRVRVSGLPDGSRLSAGTDLGHGEWVLRQDELGGLTMRLPTGFTGQVTLLAEVIDDATHIQAAPSQTMEVKVAPGELRVEPTAAPATKSRSFAEPEPKVAEPQTSEPAAAEPQAAKPETPETPSPSSSLTSPFSQLQVQAPTRQGTDVETQTARLAPDAEVATPEPKPEVEAPAKTEKSEPKTETAVKPEAEAVPAPEPEKVEPVAEVEAQPEPEAPTPEPAVSAEPEAPAPEPEVAAQPEPAAPETEVAALTPSAEVAPEPAAPAAAKNPLLAKGDQMMGLGDIASARLLYKRALKAGDPRAATAMGKSYDPVVFEQLKVHGVIPDAKLALEWYQRGESGGDSEASTYRQALTTWLKR